MSNPLLSLPKSLQGVLLALKQSDKPETLQGALNQACEKFASCAAQSGYWLEQIAKERIDLASINKTAWLFCCYFDAHLLSSSFHEWLRISQKLIGHLESSAARSWFEYHRDLLENLRQIERRAEKAFAYWQNPQEASLVELDERIRDLTDFIRPVISSLSDLRVPLHQIKAHQIKAMPLMHQQDLVLIDAFDLTCGLTTGSDRALATSPLAVMLLKSCLPVTFHSFCSSLYSPLFCRLNLTQKSEQDLVGLLNEPNNPLTFSVDSSPKLETSPKVKRALQSIQQAVAALERVPSIAAEFTPTSLQHLAKALDNYSRQRAFERYGTRERTNLLERFQSEESHLSFKRREVELTADSFLFDPFTEQLKELIEAKPQLALQPNKKISKRLPRLVHLISKLTDDQDLSSRRLFRLLSLGENQRFDHAIVVTESRLPREHDYPAPLFSSATSCALAANFIRYLDQHKFSYLIENPATQPNLESNLDQLCKRLMPLGIDAVIFHGYEPSHLAIASRLTGCKKVLFDHSLLPKVRGFDHLITGLEDVESLYGEQLGLLGCKVDTLPVFADARWQWKPHLTSKSELHFDEEMMIATSVSASQFEEFNAEFCSTVSQILLRCPKLIFAPIGAISPKAIERWLTYFDPSVHPRIHFLGDHPSGTQLMRCFDFYYNPFPLGYGQGALDAMACGCALVSMYNTSGPYEARSGGLFMGKERAISSLKPDDYIEAAVQLYEKPLLYFQASQRAFQGYEWRANLWAYVENFEKILLKILS